MRLDRWFLAYALTSLSFSVPTHSYIHSNSPLSVLPAPARCKTWACQTATRLPVLISGFARILHVAVALHHCTASNHYSKTIVVGPAYLPLVPALDSSACDTASFSMPPPPTC
ncbi:hypothetical protein COCVIDRAFT_36502 [Bipolaris victoriae FI3]|uniref:Uncharacterized protein n=1 Tax=Bipolaris victoriae (strain FI3) TaxID=930091 RepID=W7ENF1_BIPV3|nr:hypothetical protein COCVIDRAFT_36502 [Bipolaris victoriae FI3]